MTGEHKYRPSICTPHSDCVEAIVTAVGGYTKLGKLLGVNADLPGWPLPLSRSLIGTFPKKG